MSRLRVLGEDFFKGRSLRIMVKICINKCNIIFSDALKTTWYFVSEEHEENVFSGDVINSVTFVIVDESLHALRQN